MGIGTALLYIAVLLYNNNILYIIFQFLQPYEHHKSIIKQKYKNNNNKYYDSIIYIEYR